MKRNSTETIGKPAPRACRLSLVLSLAAAFFTFAGTAAAGLIVNELFRGNNSHSDYVEFLVTSDFPETVTQAQVIASQLEPLGITVEIADVDFSTWLAREGDGDFDAFMLSWVGNIDPDDFYYAQHHSEGGFNFQGYANEEVDGYLDAARVETDQDARKLLYDQAAAIIVDEASYIYLYNPENVQAWSPNVTGYQVRGDNAVRFEEASLSG